MTAAHSKAGQRNLVVAYHRIDTDDDDPLDMVVSPARLLEQLEALSAEYTIVPANEIHLRRQRPSAAITFDDGYVNNLSVAVPILLDAGLPATFFVTSDPLYGAAEFWWDRLAHAVDRAPIDAKLAVRSGRLRRRVTLRFETEHMRRQSLLSLSEAMMGRPVSFIEDTVSSVQALSGNCGSVPECERHRRMSAAQVATLAEEALFDVGSHTCSHPPLAALPDHECRRQVQESRGRLAEVLGHPPALFAYPYGRRGSMRRRDVSEVSAAGHTMAFTNERGGVEPDRDLLTVPRIAVASWPADAFLGWLRRWT
jgi:peptidoglycan/xylan/chitin deacetylase (PgdA/CDA1 family)